MELSPPPPSPTASGRPIHADKWRTVEPRTANARPVGARNKKGRRKGKMGKKSHWCPHGRGGFGCICNGDMDAHDSFWKGVLKDLDNDAKQGQEEDNRWKSRGDMIWEETADENQNWKNNWNTRDWSDRGRGNAWRISSWEGQSEWRRGDKKWEADKWRNYKEDWKSWREREKVNVDNEEEEKASYKELEDEVIRLRKAVAEKDKALLAIRALVDTTRPAANAPPPPSPLLSRMWREEVRPPRISMPPRAEATNAVDDIPLPSRLLPASVAACPFHGKNESDRSCWPTCHAAGLPTRERLVREMTVPLFVRHARNPHQAAKAYPRRT